MACFPFFLVGCCNGGGLLGFCLLVLFVHGGIVLAAFASVLPCRCFLLALVPLVSFLALGFLVCFDIRYVPRFAACPYFLVPVGIGMVSILFGVPAVRGVGRGIWDLRNFSGRKGMIL